MMTDNDDSLYKDDSSICRNENLDDFNGRNLNRFSHNLPDGANLSRVDDKSAIFGQSITNHPTMIFR